MESQAIGGIEGGATHSTCIILNEAGVIISEVKGDGTNHWITGLEECQRRIADMINRAKEKAGLSVDTPLASVGLSLSGCEQEESNNALANGLKKSYPNLSKTYFVGSDTQGALATAEDKGGVILISGTGSNALLINPDGSKFQCGGWGNVLGDEGSAYWIAHRAIKIVFDDQDNFVKPPHKTDTVWNEIKQHFEVETRFDLLSHCYANFDKPKFAGLCRRLAALANKKEPLCLYLFEEAGKLLAQSIVALYPNVDKSLLNREGGLHVVCVGSVWNSWLLLKKGFMNRIQKPGKIKEVSLLRLKTTGAIGAAYLAADLIDFKLPKSYTNNYEVFYNYPHGCNCLVDCNKKD